MSATNVVSDEEAAKVASMTPAQRAQYMRLDTRFALYDGVCRALEEIYSLRTQLAARDARLEEATQIMLQLAAETALLEAAGHPTADPTRVLAWFSEVPG